ncbi:MAG TPA: hypothetical protein VIW21_03915 [Chthoniobacterales bacterium]
MNASPAEAAPGPLLFSWEPPRQRRRAIIAFLLLSLLVHAFCFYLFQIVYPPTVALLPPPAHVSLISNTSEEGRTLLRWIGADDPALVFATQRPAEARLRALPKTNHVPSYLASAPALKPVPAAIVDLRTPSSQPPGPVPTSREPAPVLAVTPTAVLFSSELAGFGPPTVPSPAFTASMNDAPEAIRFRIALSERGEVRYSFAINSSADPALDEQARHYLMLCRFPARASAKEATAAESIIGGASSQSLVWGMATIEFGNDVLPPKPAPPKTAAP